MSVLIKEYWNIFVMLVWRKYFLPCVQYVRELDTFLEISRERCWNKKGGTPKQTPNPYPSRGLSR